MAMELAAHVDHGIVHASQGGDALAHALENAKLAEDSYNDDGAPPGFTRIREWNDATGLNAVAYRSNLDGHVVVAYRGSEGGMDWASNFSQGLGSYTPQYASAVNVAREAKAMYGSVEFTGHSLGGGQAAAAAMATGSHADTFNAAGLNPMSYAEYGLNPFNAGKIESWQVDGEILSSAQKYTPLHAVGHEHVLPAMRESVDSEGNKTFTPAPEYNNFLHPIKSMKEAADRHSRYIDSLEAAMEERIKTGLDTVRLGPATKPAALATSANCVGDMHKLLMKDGSPTVLLGPGLKPMTRRKDATICSGKVSEGLATVMVGG